MKEELKSIIIENFQTESGYKCDSFSMTYEIIGKELHSAPIVLVNHALTGNSDIASPQFGWWKSIIGGNKLIDTNKYSVIAINIPGNAYDGHIIENYQDYTAEDIAQLYLLTLEKIGVTSLFAVIGGSLGGGIAWEMAAINPELIEYLIPVASDWKATDWIIAQNYVQENILKHSSKPLYDVRMMAMLFYRTQASFAAKFNRTKTENNQLFNIESWLNHHGEKLEARFQLSAYQLMNHLLTTVDISKNKTSFEDAVKDIKSTIIQIAIDSDLLFVKEENMETKRRLDKLNIKNQYHEIKSIHGHDAFLIEFEQLSKILKPIFE